jgi:hypothetical protein
VVIETIDDRLLAAVQVVNERYGTDLKVTLVNREGILRHYLFNGSFRGGVWLWLDRAYSDALLVDKVADSNWRAVWAALDRREAA